MDFGNMCAVTLTLEIWAFIKVLSRPLDIDNYCVKDHPNKMLWTRQNVLLSVHCNSDIGDIT